ncbi:MAG: hypothetical protein RL758_252 [Pseudomonadota bacterium]|jgi:exodeoxyribonuclease-5
MQNQGITLTDSQSEVLEGLKTFIFAPRDDSGTATLGGYAGVGKTTVVGRLIKSAADQGKRVLAMAPTHQAVSVLASKMPSCTQASTVHSALGLRMVERNDGTLGVGQRVGQVRLREFDLAVVDEASMLDRALFGMLMQNRGCCRVLFVGDPAQLAPVGDGGKLLSPVFDEAIVPTQFRLTEVVRQAADNPVIRWSQVLRRNVNSNSTPDIAELGVLLREGDDKFLSIQPGGAYRLTELCIDAIRNGVAARILSFKNSSVIRHNHEVHSALHPDVDGFAEGEPAIVQSQFYAHDKETDQMVRFHTSQQVEVLSCEPGRSAQFPDVPCWRLKVASSYGSEVSVLVPKFEVNFTQEIDALFREANFQNEQARHEPMASASMRRARAAAALAEAKSRRAAFALIRHAYAMTFHKSQGSTFEASLIDWEGMADPRQSGSDKARMAYVGVTRTSKYLVVVTE